MSHLKFSPSASHRWISCPGSISLSEKAPPQPESSYAKEGTDAHLCLETLLKNHGGKPHVARAMLSKKYPSEMIEHAWDAYKWVTEKLDPHKKLLCETRVRLSHIHDELGGTLDAAIVEPFGTLSVIDFKYGAGVAVEAQDNTQMMIYALGLSYEHGHNFTELELAIVQPRAYHEQGGIRTHTITIDELLEWERDVLAPAVEACGDPLAEFSAGDHCRFCPAKTICPAISERALAQAQIDFAPDAPNEIALPVASMIESEKLGRTLDAISKLEVWIEAVKERAFLILNQNGKVPGYKLVQKRATRKWVDEMKTAKEAKKLFGDLAFSKPELLSPAQLEKAVSLAHKDWIQKRVTQVSTGLTMVPESDKRQAFNSIESDFNDEPKQLNQSRKTKRKEK